MFTKYALAAALSFASLGAGVSATQAMPLTNNHPTAGVEVITVRDGCGRNRHLNRWGHCVWNGRYIAPPIFFGFHHRHHGWDRHWGRHHGNFWRHDNHHRSHGRHNEWRHHHHR